MPRARAMPRPNAKEGKQKPLHPAGYAEMRLRKKRASKGSSDTRLSTTINLTRSMRRGSAGTK